MEKRLLLAIILSFIILIAYQALFIKPKPKEKIASKVITEAEPESTAPSLPATPAQEAKIAEKAALLPEERIEAQKEEEITVDTSLFCAVWINKGAILKSWKLKRYKNEKKEDLELVSLRAAEAQKFPFSLEAEDQELTVQVNSALFNSSSSHMELRNGEKGEIQFDYSDGKTIKAVKIFRFQDGAYDFETEIRVWKEGKPVAVRLLWGPGIGDPSEEEIKQRIGFSGGVAVFASNKVFRQSERKYKPEASAFNFVTWAAYEDNYFAALFLTPAQKGTAIFSRQPQVPSPLFFLSISLPERVFLGPKELETLQKFGHQTKNLINFGFFGAIAEVLLRGLKLIHKFIPNWGVAIIILTLIIKILFFPLTYSSTKSMAKMQELQPKIKALRAKYKKAKQDIAQRRQMNEEMMKLYKEHGINPAGGCLPLLVQIPVFWGFFRVFSVAIDLRHSPFFLWIKDLSIKDPYYILPILMGITQFISQKMAPTSADPAQTRIMLIMPVIMTIFLMNFQSGLILYWLTNNVLQIGQQLIMNRMMAKKKREKHGKGRKK